MDLALFDFDGTITTRDMYVDFVSAAVPRHRLMVGKCALAPVVLGYKAGLVPVSMIRACVAWTAFRGMRADCAYQAGIAFARDVLPGVVRQQALARIGWHRARGDTVCVVSGNFDFHLAPWTAAHGLELICSRLQTHNGVLTGHYEGAQCVGEEKARRSRERFDTTRFERVHAYGDTHEDRAMLALADVRTYQWQPA